MLTSKQRAYLKSQAMTLADTVIIGKNDIEEPVIRSAREAIEARELIKVKLLPSCLMSVRDCAEYLAGEIGAEVVQTIGGKFVLFKQKKKESAYTLPR